MTRRRKLQKGDIDTLIEAAINASLPIRELLLDIDAGTLRIIIAAEEDALSAAEQWLKDNG